MSFGDMGTGEGSEAGENEGEIQGKGEKKGCRETQWPSL